MAEVLEASGKTVEAAIASAASQLGVTTDQLDYKVLQQPSNGFFGWFGANPARTAAVNRSSPALSGRHRRSASSVSRSRRRF